MSCDVSEFSPLHGQRFTVPLLLRSINFLLFSATMLLAALISILIRQHLLLSAFYFFGFVLWESVSQLSAAAAAAFCWIVIYALMI